MRRTLFGRSPEVDLVAPARASASEALLFDVRDQSASTDLALAERRVAGWNFAPWLILSGHLVNAISLLLQDRPPASSAALAGVCIPLALSLTLDAAAGLVMLFWRRMQMAPQAGQHQLDGQRPHHRSNWILLKMPQQWNSRRLLNQQRTQPGRSQSRVQRRGRHKPWPCAP